MQDDMTDDLADEIGLRDWFAGMATDKDVEAVDALGWLPGEGHYMRTRAERRYLHADAMMAERAKRRAQE